MTSAAIELYETTIGAVTWDPERELGVFEYAPEFLGSGIEVSPITMPLGAGRFSFPNLPRETFKGLPGLLADSLPSKDAGPSPLIRSSACVTSAAVRWEPWNSAPP